MAYANIGQITTANTFDHWRIVTNNLSTALNEIGGGNFTKDVGSFTFTTGSITLSKATGDALSITANATIGGLTLTRLLVTTSPTFSATPLITVNDIVLRSAATTQGNAFITAVQGGSNGNAQLWFDNTAAVWRATSNVGNSSLAATLISTRNISDSVTTTSSSNVASLTAVKAAYDTAILAYAAANNAANTTTVSQTGNILSAQKLNFLNTSSITVSIASGSGGNADISFSSTSAGSGTVQQVNTGIGLAVSGGTSASGLNVTGTIVANSASTSQVGVVQLSDSVSTTNSSAAATPTAVKTAYDTAILSGNNVQVFANSVSIGARANLNFINTSSIIVGAAVGSTGNINVGFTLSPTATGTALTLSSTLSALNITGTSSGVVQFIGTIRDTPITTVTASASYGINAWGKVLNCTNATDITLTFDTTGGSGGGAAVTIVRSGAGNVTIANTSTIAKQNTTSYTTSKISSRYGSATVLYTSATEFILFGDIT